MILNHISSFLEFLLLARVVNYIVSDFLVPFRHPTSDMSSGSLELCSILEGQASVPVNPEEEPSRPGDPPKPHTVGKTDGPVQEGNPTPPPQRPSGSDWQSPAPASPEPSVRVRSHRAKKHNMVTTPGRVDRAPPRCADTVESGPEHIVDGHVRCVR